MFVRKSVGDLWPSMWNLDSRSVRLPGSDSVTSYGLGVTVLRVMAAPFTPVGARGACPVAEAMGGGHLGK